MQYWYQYRKKNTKKEELVSYWIKKSGTTHHESVVSSLDKINTKDQNSSLYVALSNILEKTGAVTVATHANVNITLITTYISNKTPVKLQYNDAWLPSYKILSGLELHFQSILCDIPIKNTVKWQLIQ